MVLGCEKIREGFTGTASARCGLGREMSKEKGQDNGEA
jgi:hypothetical protein